MNRSYQRDHTFSVIPSTVEGWIVVALAPAGALLGASIALFSPWLQGRTALKATLRANELKSAIALQGVFNNFRMYVTSAHSIARSGTTLEEILAEEWATYSAGAAADAELLTRSRVRRKVKLLLSVLDQSEALHRYGHGLAKSVRMEMYLAAQDGFDVVSAVIRDGRPPLSTKMRIRRLRRELRSFDLEMADFWDLTASKTNRLPTGVIRKPFKWLRQQLLRRLNQLKRRIAKAWGYLFRP